MSDIDPLAPDAPLLVLLDKKNLLGKSQEELREIVARCRAMVSQPQTLKAELKKESDKATNKKTRESKLEKNLKLMDSLGL